MYVRLCLYNSVHQRTLMALFNNLISSHHFLLHLNSPVISDIVEGDGLSNAEANKENIRLEIEILSVGISGNSL